MTMKRTNSAAQLTTPGGARTICFGVSQGYYAIRTGVTLGTSSLGPCFALVAWGKGQKLFLAHVQADTTTDSLTTAIDDAIPEPVGVRVVRGKNTSQPTQIIIDAMKKHYAAKKVLVSEHTTDTAALVSSPQGVLSMPADITATNDRDYKVKSELGSRTRGQAPIVNMDA
jgi:hypothetical protein